MVKGKQQLKAQSEGRRQRPSKVVLRIPRRPHHPTALVSRSHTSQLRQALSHHVVVVEL